MKTMTMLTLAILLIAGSALAVIDPDPNSVGIYFDTDGDVVETNVAIGVPFDAYIILANPTTSALAGFELGFEISSPNVFLLAAFLPPNALNVGTNQNLIVGLGTPLDTTEATVLVTINMLVLAPETVYLRVFNSTPSSFPGSQTPAILTFENEILDCGTSSFFDGMPQVNAIMNGIGVVATENATLDQVKSLYR